MQFADDSTQKMKEEILEKKSYELSERYTSIMALGGFCLIYPGKTCTFSVGNVAACMYVSVVCSYTVWVANFPFDPKMHGCLAISEVVSTGGRNIVVILPYNPEAVWLSAKKGDQLPSDVIFSGPGIGLRNKHLYFGRKASVNGGMPCAVTSVTNNDGNFCNMWLLAENVRHESGELLKNTGFELIRAKRGDPIPPNAVMTGVTEADGSLFVGRVGGSIPCHITTEDGKIQSFVYGSDTEKRVANGEVMVLTR